MGSEVVFVGQTTSCCPFDVNLSQGVAVMAYCCCESSEGNQRKRQREEMSMGVIFKFALGGRKKI